ncbi:hypothetical protein QJS66_23010 [Kocuria rhizophila]|nr:hypothetical protein QJS66_23010 [Kocuria rhizophila]
MIEFIGLGLLLLVPIVYLVITVSVSRRVPSRWWPPRRRPGGPSCGAGRTSTAPGSTTSAVAAQGPRLRAAGPRCHRLVLGWLVRAGSGGHRPVPA